MKKVFVILSLFSTFHCYSQAQIINSIPANGISLNKGWKFHIGDNPDFAKPGFDDAVWSSINPALSIPELKQVNTSKPLWLRIKFSSSFKNIAITISQSGASEVFLNGHLIQSFGTIDSKNKKNIAYDPLNDYLIFHLDSPDNTLAVRYYFQPDINYKSMFDGMFPLFKVYVYSSEKLLEQNINKTQDIWNGFNMGVPLILFVVHFILFLFYTPVKANLWYSLFSLASAISNLFIYYYGTANYLVDKNGYSLFATIFSGISNIFLMYAIYLLLNQRIKWLIIIFSGLSIIGILSSNVESNQFGDLYQFFLTLLYVTCIIYMGLVAKKQGNLGGNYVIFGLLACIVFWSLFIISYYVNWNQLTKDILFHLTMLSLPVTISTLLGLQFRNTSKSLIQNLEKINTLSLEKQQILFLQNETLEKQVKKRTAELNNSLDELKSTQAQLIQSEKMASLGELTAGIAHEIQNPLNFVNNFSEVNKELINELEEEADKGNINEIKAIAKDLKENEQKINHHGKRADAIVKGMMQHSQVSTGQKQPTDINALADEYLRLSYHGLRAKDKNFNADFKTNFDERIDKIAVVPQDIGRVLLNLFNNAFYAVNEKKKTADENYKPTVSIQTKKIDDKIEIIVSDNGNGIPQKIVDKIFQPFFTTKPTGQGTGLGLSLSYDIIKAHGGEIKVETKEGKGTTFTISFSPMPY